MGKNSAIFFIYYSKLEIPVLHPKYKHDFKIKLNLHIRIIVIFILTPDRLNYSNKVSKWHNSYRFVIDNPWCDENIPSFQTYIYLHHFISEKDYHKAQLLVIMLGIHLVIKISTDVVWTDGRTKFIVVYAENAAIVWLLKIGLMRDLDPR